MSSTGQKEHWEAMYACKSPLRVSWHQNDPAISLQLIENAAIKKDDYIIDVGGGASLLVDRLYETGHTNLAILDISANALEFTKKRLGKTVQNIEWHEADVREFHPPHPYSLWHDRAVFHFLTEKSDRNRYVETLKQAVPPRGRVVLAAFAIGGPEKCSGLDIVQYDSRKLLDALGPEFRLVEELSEIHVTPTGEEQNFSWFRLIRL